MERDFLMGTPERPLSRNETRFVTWKGTAMTNTLTPNGFEIEFVDAPPPAGRVANGPGKWARVRRMKISSCHAAKGAFKAGRDKGIDPDLWEFASRMDPEDKRYGFIYARYVG